MLPILLASGAFAAVSMQRSSDDQNVLSNQESDRDIESFFNNRSRDRALRPGKTLIAENSRIVRPSISGVQHPEDAAKAWDEYHRKYENVATQLSSANYAGGDHARYFKNDINKRPRRPNLPDRESFSDFEVVPTAHFEYEDHPSTVYPDLDYSWYDDQNGDAITVNGAPHYIFTDNEFLGNPWGPSGQLFNTGDMRTKSRKDLQRDKIPDEIKKNNRVRFYGLPQ